MTAKSTIPLILLAAIDATFSLGVFVLLAAAGAHVLRDHWATWATLFLVSAVVGTLFTLLFVGWFGPWILRRFRRMVTWWRATAAGAVVVNRSHDGVSHAQPFAGADAAAAAGQWGKYLQSGSLLDQPEICSNLRQHRRQRRARRDRGGLRRAVPNSRA
jgi:hypothetical protein